jgi:hypothetical protein
MSKARIIKWHRRLGWIAATAVILWGMSGLLHPLMTWTNPRPANFAPPAIEEFAAPSMASLKSAFGDTDQVLGLRVIDNILQVTQADKKTYIDLKTKKEIADADKDRAIMLARHYTGLTDVPVKETELITHFSNSYPYINRYLPAWRVTFERPDNLTAYVETTTDRLGSITNDRKVLLQTLFQTIHTGHFLQHAEPLRLLLIFTLVASIIPISVLGIYLLFAIRRPKGIKAQGSRRWHRVLAFIAWIPLFMFPTSGLFHLLKTSPLFYKEEIITAPTFKTADIKNIPSGAINDLHFIITPDGQGWWAAKRGTEIEYSSDQKLDEEKFARAFAQMKSPAEEIASVEKITSFSNEYGFAYKRLPVWRVEFKNAATPLLFLEPQTVTVAARITPMDAAETWSFSTLHKWQFLDKLTHRLGHHGPANHMIRDVIMIVFVSIALALTVFGVAMLIKSRR